MKAGRLAYGLLPLALLAIAWAYQPGLKGPFLFDDLPNILFNPAVQPQVLTQETLEIAFNGNRSGPLGRKFPALSFALNYAMGDSSFNVWIFKVTNLAIHLLSTCLVFSAALLLIRQSRLAPQFGPAAGVATAAGTALLWGLHPLLLTSVLYVVQRMTSMAGLWVFLGMTLYLWGRAYLAAGKAAAWPLILCGYAVALLLGAFSKETALLFPFLVAAAELTLLEWRRLGEQRARHLRRFLVATTVAPALLGGLWLILQPDFVLQGYTGRDFNLWERLLTQTRALWFYASLFFFPVISRFSLFHDSFTVSRGLFSPATTAPALLALLAVLIFACAGRRRYPVLCFAALWFLVGHGMESTIFSLELVYEHRNYVPSFALAFAVAILGYRLISLGSRRSAFACVAVLVLGVLAFATHTRASLWSDAFLIGHFTARNHPGSVRGNLAWAIGLSHQPEGRAKAYAAIRRAALASADPKPVVEMWRIATWSAQHLDEMRAQMPKLAAQAAAPAPESYAAPLRLDAHYLERLNKLLAEEVSARMLAGPIVPELTSSFRMSVICILSAGEACANQADQMLEWLELGLSHGRGTKAVMAELALMAAKLQAHDANIEAAHALLDRAIRLSGNGAYFLKEKATFFIALDQPAKALPILNGIIEDPEVLPFERYNAELLRRGVLERLGPDAGEGAAQGTP